MEQRVARLERWVALLMLTCLVLLAGLLMGAGQGVAETVRCRRLEVVDATGTVRIRLATQHHLLSTDAQPEMPMLEMGTLTGDAKGCVQLDGNPRYPTLRLTGAAKNTGVFMGDTVALTGSKGIRLLSASKDGEDGSLTRLDGR